MPRLHSSIVSMLDHTSNEWGAQAALVVDGQSLSYNELRACVLGLARWLALSGAAGQRVATLLPNSLTACIAPYAVAAAGAQQGQRHIGQQAHEQDQRVHASGSWRGCL